MLLHGYWQCCLRILPIHLDVEEGCPVRYPLIIISLSPNITYSNTDQKTLRNVLMKQH